MKDLEWSFIEPVAVDSNGVFVSHNVHYEISAAQSRSKRSTDSTLEYSPDIIRYRLRIEGKPVNVQLEHNSQLYSNNLVIEKRFHNSSKDDESTLLSHCHFRGQIEGDASSKMAISTCNGLVGFLYSNVFALIDGEEGFWCLRYILCAHSSLDYTTITCVCMSLYRGPCLTAFTDKTFLKIMMMTRCHKFEVFL